MLDLAQLQTLVHLALKLLTQSAHLVLLLLHELCFSCENLFVAVFHVNLTLPLFHLISALLHLMSFLIVLLLGQVGLDLAQVQKLSREFEGQWKGLFKILSVLLQIFGVTVLQLLDLHLVFLLGLLELHIVVLIEVLILLNVSLLDLFLSLLVRKDELLVLHVELLLFELLDTVLSHFSLYSQLQNSNT